MDDRHGHCEFLPGIELWAQSSNELVDYLAHRVETGETTFIVTLNPIMVLASRKDRDFAKVIETADVIVADGQGVRWAYRKLHNKDVPLIPGVELAERIVELSGKKKWGIGLVGGQEGVWEKAADCLINKYPGIVVKGGNHGYFNQNDEIDIVSALAALKLEVLIVGMGSPKQEMFLMKHLDLFNGAIVIGAGGSLDIYSGQVKRAPKLYRNLKLEWLWRMIREPSRFSQFFSLVKFWWMIVIRHKTLFNSAKDDKMPWIPGG